MNRNCVTLSLLLGAALGGSLTSLAAQESIAGTFANLTFRQIGPINMSGRIVDIAVVESNPFTFYVASATGGVWKTTNNGVTFEPVFANEGTHSVGAIAVHQLDTNIVWVGTGERARDVATEIDEILPLLTEVRRRLTQLYNRIDGWAGPPTADQHRQLAYLAEWVVRLQPRVERIGSPE